ncbi:DUF262 domain-containing protein [Sphingobacterium faecale]|uniref:DUF262 domain-containing protein n=1 Tax=Sphingobacterium faecale TaxID=2803775 RepID=A0ABS1R1X2_9SPHI|nr:DUF262 domain-containing protein [Sphingobacterium faecale]MBL1408702.1 DUF262 domain-containing protein [Sphingobacterium faecale]
MSNASFKSIGDYFFTQKKQFVIPNYQRGFKWAVKKKGDLSAVEKLCVDLIKAQRDKNYFLQGVTVCEEDNRIILIDGQQRTTTLYLILWFLDISLFNKIDLCYDIREKSKEFISNLKDSNFDYHSFDPADQNQDVFYFKKAIGQIENTLSGVDKQFFLNFLLQKVNILYIVIDADKATKTFTMMNGAKAIMLPEELIKAEILRQISLSNPVSIAKDLNNNQDNITKEWEVVSKRSRHAREWDRWLYWWNREDVQDFFSTTKPLGFLLQFYFFKYNPRNIDVSFNNFKKLLNEKTATDIFKELRHLQKSFEDVLKEPKAHNYLKLALLCSEGGTTDTFDIINFFFLKKSNTEELSEYAKWRLVGATHKEIIKEGQLKEGEHAKEDKARLALRYLSNEFVYGNYNSLALRQFLRLNVEEDNKLFGNKGRKFDFSIYGDKSLEHIHPKSKAYYSKVSIDETSELISYFDGNNNFLDIEPTGAGWLNRDSLEQCSEHSIGNLVLLDKNENSKFSDKPFIEKKDIYFNVNESFKSRNLLHSIAVFSKSDWTKKDIEENQINFLRRFKKDYGISE